MSGWLPEPLVPAGVLALSAAWSGNVIAGWAVAFAMTLVAEGSVVALVWRLRRTEESLRGWLFAVLVVNAVSHPLMTALWQVLPQQGPATLRWFVGIEIVVATFEAWGYRRLRQCRWPAAVVTSVAANLVTAALSIHYSFPL